MAVEGTPSSAGNNNGLMCTPQTLTTPQTTGYVSAFEGSTLQNQAYQYYSDGRTAQSRNHPPKKSDGRIAQSMPSFDMGSQSTSCRDEGTVNGSQECNEEMSIGDPQSRKTKGQKKQNGRLKSAVEKAVNASKKKKVPPSQDNGNAQRQQPSLLNEVNTTLQLQPQPLATREQQHSSGIVNPCILHQPSHPQRPPLPVNQLNFDQRPEQPIHTHNPLQPHQPHQLVSLNVCQSRGPLNHSNPSISRELFLMKIEFPWDFRRNTCPNNASNGYTNQQYPTLSNGAYSNRHFQSGNASTSTGDDHERGITPSVLRPFFAMDSHANRVMH